MNDAEIRGLLAHLTPAERAELDALAVPPSSTELLARLTDRELDLLEAALVSGDTAGAQGITATAEERLAAGAPPWMDTVGAPQAREAERRWYWRLLPEALADAHRSGRPVNYEALERAARRRAEAERSTQ